jgi:hypothetical protein
MITESFIQALEKKLPEDFLPDHTLEEKLLIVLGVWQDMRQTIETQQSTVEKLIKDFEYTLNLLNSAEPAVAEEELKKTINDWLEYYRNISNS